MREVLLSSQELTVSQRPDIILSTQALFSRGHRWLKVEFFNNLMNGSAKTGAWILYFCYIKSRRQGGVVHISGSVFPAL